MEQEDARSTAPPNSPRQRIVAEPFGIVRRAALTAKLNDVDPQAWLADVLARIADHKITNLAALLPWNWYRPLPVDRAA